ncbi:MAG: hypothetical protein V4665_00450 [Patescibacteria group bacterium]
MKNNFGNLNRIEQSNVTQIEKERKTGEKLDELNELLNEKRKLDSQWVDTVINKSDSENWEE